MKVAYICEPQVGGAFVFFTQLRPLLASLGIDFRCIPPVNQAAYHTSGYWGQDGVDFLDLSSNTSKALGQIIQHLAQQDFRSVLTLPGCHILGTALPAYLPVHIACVAKIPHNGRGTYRPAQEFEPYIEAFAPVNYLLADDLAGRYGVPSHKLKVVHIGIHTERFAYQQRPKHAGPFRIIFVGRLNDLEKNICLLPDIVRATRGLGVPVHCTVVGSGGDGKLLEAKMIRTGQAEHFTLTGAVAYSQIPALLQQADVFLMPSRFEGCPHALMEAMSTGCVPVVSHLRGTLDRIVEEGVSGLMAPVGNAQAFARAIVRLAQDTPLRQRMGAAARRTVLDRFTIEHMAEAYAGVFQEAALHPSQDPPPRALANFTPPASMAPTWRQWIPMPVKKIVRTFYGRLGKSI